MMQCVATVLILLCGLHIVVKAGKCIKTAEHIDMIRSMQAMKTSPAGERIKGFQTKEVSQKISARKVKCPDGGTCKDGQSCCPGRSIEHRCCPTPFLPDCCRDGIHCCPYPTRCRLYGLGCVHPFK